MDLDEEAEIAQIDAEHRHRAVRDEPQRAEHGPVAAEADERVHAVGERVVGDRLDPGRTTSDVGVAHVTCDPFAATQFSSVSITTVSSRLGCSTNPIRISSMPPCAARC